MRPSDGGTAVGGTLEDGSGGDLAATYPVGGRIRRLPLRLAAMSVTDPFPRAEFGRLVRHLPAYARLAWRLAREPLLSRARRAAVLAAAGYLASPIDAVPGVIPVVGQLDDVAVAIAAIRFALAGLDADRRRAHLAAVGLADGDLSHDLRTTGTITAWLVRVGARGGLRGGRLGARAAIRLVRAARGPAGVAVRRLTGRRATPGRSGD